MPQTPSDGSEAREGGSEDFVHVSVGNWEHDVPMLPEPEGEEDVMTAFIGTEPNLDELRQPGQYAAAESIDEEWEAAGIYAQDWNAPIPGPIRADTIAPEPEAEHSGPPLRRFQQN